MQFNYISWKYQDKQGQLIDERCVITKMEDLAKKEKKRMEIERLRKQSEEARLEHEERQKDEQKRAEETKAKKSRKMLVIASVIILILAIGGYAFINSKKPGRYDEFAKCLSEKGAVMYGADGCMYSQAQRTMFGKSFKFVNYKDYTKGPNIKITPTWVINNNIYERVQSFERLSALTECKFN